MRPQDTKGMQRFLGMINFYMRFIQGAAGILRPLTDELHSKPRGRVCREGYFLLPYNE